MIESLRAIRRVLRAGKLQVSWALAAAASLAAGAALGAVPPIITGHIIDGLQREDHAATLRDLATYVVVTIAVAAVGLANAYATTSFREGVARNLRIALMGKLLAARLDALESLTLGEIANRLNEDLEALCYRFEYAIFPSVSAACQLAATLTAMVAIDFRLALIACIAVALSLFPPRLVAGRFAELTRAEAENHDARVEVVAENASLAGLTVLRHALAAKRQLERYRDLADETRRIRVSSAVLGAKSSLLTTFSNLIGPAAILGVGAVFVHHGVTVGTLVTFLMYQSRLYVPFTSLSNLPLQVMGCGVLSRRVLQISDLEEESSGDRPFVDGAIELENICVRKATRSVISGASLSIAAGRRVALVGPSGAGKSSIAALLPRLVDSAAGTVRIGGQDVRDIDLASLRESVAIVPQDPLVFDASLWDNLTYLNPSATAVEVSDAVAICRLKDVVARLPDGFNAQLGQRGFRLSGGERQRVCLARTLIARPKIVILDEALTGVDVEMEAGILHDMVAARAFGTLVVITHRLHSVAGFDHLIVIEDSKVTVQGTHAHARAQSVWYREAFERSAAPAGSHFHG